MRRIEEAVRARRGAATAPPRSASCARLRFSSWSSGWRSSLGQRLRSNTATTGEDWIHYGSVAELERSTGGCSADCRRPRRRGRLDKERSHGCHRLLPTEAPSAVVAITTAGARVFENRHRPSIDHEVEVRRHLGGE